MRYTKSYAKEILDEWKHKSALFSGGMTVSKVEYQLTSLGISTADSIAITMALIIAGAKLSN